MTHALRIPAGLLRPRPRFSLSESRQTRHPRSTAMSEAADDAALISRALGGEAQAFGLLVERHFGAAYASAYAVLANASDAEELAQETFVQAYEKLERLREPAAFVGWIWRIAHDLALKHLRKQGRMKVVSELPEQAQENPPSGALIGGEERQALAHALEQLPEDMRQALLMKYWQELDYDEMARRSGVSAEALYQRVCRGLKRLRDLLAEGGNA